MKAAAIALLLAAPLVEGQTDSGAWRMYGDGKTSFTRVSSATKCSVSS